MFAIPLAVTGHSPLGSVNDLLAWATNPPAPPDLNVSHAAARPIEGYVGGSPTPQAVQQGPPPTLVAPPLPTPLPPTKAPAVVPTAPVAGLASRSASSVLSAGMIRGNGSPVAVRRSPGSESPSDPTLPDGSPILVSPSPIVVDAVPWLAIRGLGGVTGWVPRTSVAIDGVDPMVFPSNPVPGGIAPAASPSPAPTSTPIAPFDPNGVVAHTDGQGVILRGSPNDEDKTTVVVPEGVAVTVLSQPSPDWSYVLLKDGTVGWIPTAELDPLP